MTTEFTHEFIVSELAKATKAKIKSLKNMTDMTCDPLFFKILTASEIAKIPDFDDRDRMDNFEYIISAANHFEDAIREIERLTYEVEDRQGVIDLGKVAIFQLQTHVKALELVIRGMFPMWASAMGYCEHGRQSELMAMRNYYNGRDNPMTNEDIHLMFSLIPEKGGEK